MWQICAQKFTQTDTHNLNMSCYTIKELLCAARGGDSQVAAAHGIPANNMAFHHKVHEKLDVC